ncbi:primary amine oxidase [Genlisea aurea]|uniref:Amine oxidase n=1 Tax=Genlisea aurea TaxID=192259 RepID=S8D626_9LAMI|nr:primary amine oxidase [Genlisea aurea]
MEAKNSFMLILLAVSAVLLFTVFTSHSSISTASSELTDCAANSGWCTAKNRILRRPTAASLSANHSSDVAGHPLDPLTLTEIAGVRDRLVSFFGGSGFSVHSLVLDEPDKDAVRRWKKGDPLPQRQAAVIARAAGKNYLLTVDLESGAVSEQDSSHVSGFPLIALEEMQAVIWAPFKNPDFNNSIIERGLDLNDVVCLPFSPGWFGDKEDGKRLVKLECFTTKDTANFYMRPIEGIIAVTDIDENEVVEFIDRGKKKHIPIPKADGTDYRLSSDNSPVFKLPNPVSMEQPNGPNFVIEGNHLVKWANWEFHLKPDPRAGVVVSQARVRDPDTGLLRNVMYKGFASELFVPYMDPEEAWYFKTYMDAGEYGFGLQALALDPLNDCPRNAVYMDAVFAASDGSPYVRSNMICIFERYAGDAAWRHTEAPIVGDMIREARPKISLVARMVASLANYDYIIDWEFHADGLIHVKVSLTGIVIVKGTSYVNTNQVNENEDVYGTLLSDNIIGVVHDHYVNFHLDMDVDGPDNSFLNVHLKRAYTDGKSPRKSYMKVEKQVAKTEKEAQIKLKLYDPSEFHVINPNKRTKVGNPVGYKIVPAGTAASLLDPEDPPQKRAAFTNNQIWVTGYNRSQQWSGGLFAYQSHGEDTLQVWSDRDGPIENRDIVLWYTLGFHHVPCQEDFPIMPTVSSGFDLKPVNFFERNPVLRVAPYDDNQLPVCKAAAASA